MSAGGADLDAKIINNIKNTASVTKIVHHKKSSPAARGAAAASHAAAEAAAAEASTTAKAVSTTATAGDNDGRDKFGDVVQHRIDMAAVEACVLLPTLPHAQGGGLA